MFKRKLLAALMTTVIAGFGGYALNASADTATGTANATILTPLSITSGAAMNFGSIAPSLAGGSVVLSNAGAITPVAGFVFSGATSAGVFSVLGSGTLTYAITLPANGVVTLTDQLGNGGTAMAVNVFNSNPSGTGALTAGAQTLNVGATLVVGGSQIASDYSGTYDVIVNYN